MQDRFSWEEAGHCLSSISYSLVLKHQRSWSQKLSVFLGSALYWPFGLWRNSVLKCYRPLHNTEKTQRRQQSFWEHCRAMENNVALLAEKLLEFPLRSQEGFLEMPGRNHDLTVSYLLSQGNLHKSWMPWHSFETVVAVSASDLLICTCKCASITSKTSIAEETRTALAYLIFHASFCFAVVDLSSQYEKQTQESWIFCKNNFRNLLILATAVCVWTCYTIRGENLN